ncbi:uncharacterized protein LOC120503489 [Passer montanus]|uniref:uncharacterized protein LOC120503489 n=1 Tax=Passer montanus TaxID=9160 RepID=UPI0019609679|nr:uncharacterized protein LOC120503489 [Passer montanus]
MLAGALGQDHLCLTTASAADPLLTCLVGIPLPPDEFPEPLYSYLEPLSQNKVFRPSSPNPNLIWRRLMFKLNISKSEPIEFKLLGSASARLCIEFFPFPGRDERSFTPVIEPNQNYAAGNWCSVTSHITTSLSLDDKPRALPNGVFLICGDRAWAGIPSRLIGGPCTFGRLTLFAPNNSQIKDWKEKIVAHNSARITRDLKDLDEQCDSKIVHWSKPEGVAWTVFLPWVSIAKSLGELAHLECWVAKQANLTSAALSDLLSDEEITRQATLQNRAAIDFLLLLHDHRCKEFEGLCCLNLTSKTEDARSSIYKMKGMINDIKERTSDWLGDLFTGWGLSGWVASVLKTVVLVLFVLLVILISISIIWRILKRLILKLISSEEVNRVVVEEGVSDEDEEGSSEGEEYQMEDHPWSGDLPEDSF